MLSERVIGVAQGCVNQKADAVRGETGRRIALGTRLLLSEGLAKTKARASAPQGFSDDAFFWLQLPHRAFH